MVTGCTVGRFERRQRAHAAVTSVMAGSFLRVSRQPPPRVLLIAIARARRQRATVAGNNLNRLATCRVTGAELMPIFRLYHIWVFVGKK